MREGKRELQEYLQWLTVEKGRSGATIDAYSRDCRAFLEWLSVSSLTLNTLTTQDIERYVNHLQVTKAASSVARAVSTLKGWFGFLVDDGVLSKDVTAVLSPVRRGRTLPKPLDEAVIVDLIESISGDTPVDLRDRALLELLYGTGARVSEVTSLQLQDLDFDEELVRVTGKGSKQRLVPMGRALSLALRNYLGPGGRSELLQGMRHAKVFANHRGGPLSRQGIDLIIDGRALMSGIDRSSISAHVFRHSCATHMLAHGADIRVVQELLGHASIATTQSYTAVSIVSLQRAYESAHPRANG